VSPVIVIIALLGVGLITLSSVGLASAVVTTGLTVTSNSDTVTLDQISLDGVVYNLNAFVGSVGATRSFTFTASVYPANYEFTCTTAISFQRSGTLPIQWGTSDVEGCLIFLFTKGGPGVVGGTTLPVDKLALLAPFIGLVSLIVTATTVTAVYFRRAKHREEKQ
jgi:hypothetical protein